MSTLTKEEILTRKKDTSEKLRAMSARYIDESDLEYTGMRSTLKRRLKDMNTLLSGGKVLGVWMATDRAARR